MPDHDWARVATESLRRGDPTALAEVYDRLGPGVAAAVVRATRRSADFAFDCVQDTMVTLATKPPLCATEGDLRAWLRTVAINHARTRLLSEVRRARREQAAAGGAPTAGGAQPASDDARARSSDSLAAAREALALAQTALSHEDFIVVDLVLWRGVTRRVAAGLVGKSVATVDRVLARALAILRGGAA